jgi:hypothetical protein
MSDVVEVATTVVTVTVEQQAVTVEQVISQTTVDAGVRGPQGATGEAGTVGPVGPTGPQGPAGADRTAQVRSDYVSPYSYLGVASVGSIESAEVWRITRIEQHSDGTVTTATAENVAWDDRLTATYT